jgi:RHS repeat-associated protein
LGELEDSRQLIGSAGASYGYDSSKQRVYKITGDSTTLYYNDIRGNTLSELTGDGTPLENYIYLGDQLISKVSYNRLGDVFRDGTRDLTDAILALSVVGGEKPEKPLFLASDVSGDKKIGLDETIFDLSVASGLNPSSESEVFFYDTDYLGTSVTLSSLSGNAVWQVDELPFGEEYEQDGISDINKRRYIGKEKDVETGLLYFGARYLKAPHGRFTSSDPVGLVGKNGKINPDILSDPQRLNRYTYGLNNPYRYIDPDGEFPFLIPLAIISGEALGGLAGHVLGATVVAATTAWMMNEGGEAKEDESESLDKTDHAKDRINQGNEGDANRQIGDPNRTVKEGRQFTDSKTGHKVHVKGNKVVISDSKSGKQITQFKNSRSNTQKRIKSGKWVHKKKND